jgi:PRTRC genetic system protein C
MALDIKSLTRVFKYDGNQLSDPNKNFSPDEVMNFYSNTYPELTTSTVHGPEIDDEKAVYEFKTTVGTKG